MVLVACLGKTLVWFGQSQGYWHLVFDLWCLVGFGGY